jgi:ABC-2 type transport system permease protein
MNNPYSSTIDPNSTIGTYIGLAIIQIILITFIVPALTAGAISGERERQTLDLLLCTKLSPRSIILGKLFASMSHIILLVVASLPIFSIVFLFGGISYIEVIQLFGYCMVLAVTFGAIGIFLSTYFKRTTVSTVLAYGVIAFMTLGLLFIAAMYMAYYGRINNQIFNEVLTIMYFNPAAGFASLIGEQIGRADMLGIPGMGRGQGAANFLAIWKGNIIFNLVLTVVLLELSSRKLNPLKEGGFKRFKGFARKRDKK